MAEKSVWKGLGRKLLTLRRQRPSITRTAKPRTANTETNNSDGISNDQNVKTFEFLSVRDFRTRPRRLYWRNNGPAFISSGFFFFFALCRSYAVSSSWVSWCTTLNPAAIKFPTIDYYNNKIPATERIILYLHNIVCPVVHVIITYNWIYYRAYYY